ncbi:MAG TPA: hypothetical protein VES88_09825 [Gemmatimonadaceae bacterium]|nr:hypothetical protein [Gemmatimonadaceae bacterium]
MSRPGLVVQSLARPYKVTIPMVVLVGMVPFYIFIAGPAPGRTQHVPGVAIGGLRPNGTVMAGGGVREKNVRSLLSVSGVREVHVRLTRLTQGGQPPARRDLSIRRPLPKDEGAWEETDERRVRSFVRTVAAISEPSHGMTAGESSRDA